MRILHVETRHRRGGAERNVLHTARWEASRGHDVHLAVGADSIVEGIPSGITVHVIPSLVRAVSPVQDWRALRQLRRLVKDGHFDLVHTHQSKAGILGRLAARGVAPRIVHTIHMASFGPSYGRLSSVVFTVAERFCARFTDVIITVGHELQELYLKAGVGKPDQYMVIHSPIDIESFRGVRDLSSQERGVLRRRFGLSENARVAVVIASLERRKRVDLIVSQLGPLLLRRELQLAIAGDGLERERITRLTRDIGVASAVHLLGHVDDVPALLGTADVLVHAATVEGVPQVTIQALAAGVPVVATEMVGIHEIGHDAVSVVPQSGAGLLAVVTQRMQGRDQRVDMDRLKEWSPTGVDAALARLHHRLRMA